MRVLDTISWIVAVVYSTIPSYWLVVHPRIQRWRARGATLSRVGPIWLLLWVAMGAITWRWRYVHVYRSAAAWIPGAVLIGIGFVVYSGARHNFTTDQVLGRSELQPERHEQRLNTSGIRARVRHPYYLGHLCELLGWGIGSGLAVVYAMTAFAVITGAVMIQWEERELEDRFGEAYREYKRRTPAILPRISAAPDGSHL